MHLEFARFGTKLEFSDEKDEMYQPRFARMGIKKQDVTPIA